MLTSKHLTAFGGLTEKEKNDLIGLESERFSKFVYSIEHLRKCVKALEAETAMRLGIKGVHIFWIYSLIDKSEGLTASEIARKNNINRSLVSREVEELIKEEIVCYCNMNPSGGKYNAKIVLTDKGRKVADEILRIGIDSQNKTSADISEDELELFYSVLERMSENLSKISKTRK